MRGVENVRPHLETAISNQGRTPTHTDNPAPAREDAKARLSQKQRGTAVLSASPYPFYALAFGFHTVIAAVSSGGSL